ncbi:hypothetical protein D3C76_1076140 [compost metagenome]
MIVRRLHQAISGLARCQTAIGTVDHHLFGQVDRPHLAIHDKLQPIAFATVAGDILDHPVPTQVIQSMGCGVPLQVVGAGTGHLIHHHKWPRNQRIVQR